MTRLVSRVGDFGSAPRRDGPPHPFLAWSRDAAPKGVPDENLRQTLVDVHTGLVERSEAAPHRAPAGFDTRYQIVLPYYGLFGYCTGSRELFFDANHVLFTTPGREFRDTHPVHNLGHGSVVVTPADEVLEEICGPAGPAKHPAFLAASQPARSRLKLLVHHLLRPDPEWADRLRMDEILHDLLLTALAGARHRPVRAGGVIRQAKEILHEQAHEVLSLKSLARAVGVSSVYLTQEFSRSEGMPLFRYQKRLRLSRALRDLPHTDDITALALELGFSSHSHFSYAFREEFGLTPSQHREGRALRRPLDG